MFPSGIQRVICVFMDGGLLFESGWNIEICYGMPVCDFYLWHVVTGCKFSEQSIRGTTKSFSYIMKTKPEQNRQK